MAHPLALIIRHDPVHVHAAVPHWLTGTPSTCVRVTLQHCLYKSLHILRNATFRPLAVLNNIPRRLSTHCLIGASLHKARGGHATCCTRMEGCFNLLDYLNRYQMSTVFPDRTTRHDDRILSTLHDWLQRLSDPWIN